MSYADIRRGILERGFARIAIEGNIGVGKTSLARLVVKRLGGRMVEDRVDDNPFLERFYEDLGFTTASEPYDEDGIEHVEMLRDERAGGAPPL